MWNDDMGASASTRLGEVMSLTRLKVRTLPFGDTTKDGRFYPTIDGEAWGEDGRAFWHTRAEALRVGIKCFTKLLEEEGSRHVEG